MSTPLALRFIDLAVGDRFRFGTPQEADEGRVRPAGVMTKVSPESYRDPGGHQFKAGPFAAIHTVEPTPSHVAPVPGLPRVFDTLDDAVRALPGDTRAVGTIAAPRFANARAALLQLASVLGYELAVVPHNHGRHPHVSATPRATPAPSATPNAPAPAGEEVTV